MRLTFESDRQQETLAKLGFGTWGLGGDSYGTVSESHARGLISYAYQKGIRTFDTSPLYGNGRSESLLGNVLHLQPRSSYALITKAGLYNSGSTELRGFSDKEISQSLAGSISRLRTDFIDFFLLHSPTHGEIAEGKEHLYGLRSAVEQGVIRNFGVSLKSPSDFSFVNEVEILRVIEFNYSLMDQRAQFFDTAQSGAQGLYKIARTPYNFGFLTDTPPGKTPPTSPLNHLKNWSQKQFDLWHEFRGIWADIATMNDLTLDELALTFVLSSHFVDLVIPGFMEIEHIDAALRAVNRGPLSKESQNDLAQIYRVNQSKFVVAKL